MSKIYIITKGYYSDYHIVAATTDPTVAEQIKNRYADPNDEEETKIEIFDDGIETINKTVYQVYYKTNEKEIKINSQENNDEYAYTAAQHNQCWVNKRKDWCVYCFSDDADHAAKIAYDRIAEHRAKLEGIT